MGRGRTSQLLCSTSVTAEWLEVANTGTLLGPPLIRGKSEKGLELMANVEMLPGQEELPSILGSIGTSLEMHVSHPVDLPDPIEAATLIWRRP